MIINLDIETIPDQRKGAYETFLKEAIENFKAPSSLSKKQALEDLGLNGNQEPQKYWTKDDTIAEWCKQLSQEKAPAVAEENYRKTALDGTQGEIFSIAFAAEDNLVTGLKRDTAIKDGKLLISPESDLLTNFFKLLNLELNGRHAFFVGHNITFDLKFLYQRSVITRVKPAFGIPHWGRHQKDYFDTMQAWAGYGNRISQDDLCKAIGIEGKPSHIDGSMVWDYVRGGEGDQVLDYNMDDVVKNREIYKRLNFIETLSFDRDQAA